MFRTFGLLTLFSVYGIAIGPLLLLGLAIPYVVLKLQGSQDVEQDSQVGLKCGLYFIYSLSILLALLGLTIIVADLVAERHNFDGPRFDPDFGRPPMVWDDPWPTEAQRMGGAFLLAGLLSTLIHFLLIRGMTNDDRHPATCRVFVGWRLAICSLVVFLTATMLIVVCFQKNFGEKELRKTLLMILVVWVPAWMVHLALLRAYPARSRRRSSVPVADFVPLAREIDEGPRLNPPS